MSTSRCAIAIVVGSSLVAGTAGAEDPPTRLDAYGLQLTAGVGVGGFTRDTMRGATAQSGLWEVRLALGTRQQVGLEAAYVGSAQAIDALGLDRNAVLVGTAVEALARISLRPEDDLSPYVVLGGAWKRYDLVNADINTSDVGDHDNLLEVPIGLGLSYRHGTLVGDVRGEFRAARYADLLTSDGATAEMHTWGVTAGVGYAY